MVSTIAVNRMVLISNMTFFMAVIARTQYINVQVEIRHNRMLPCLGNLQGFFRSRIFVRLVQQPRMDLTNFIPGPRNTFFNHSTSFARPKVCVSKTAAENPVARRTFNDTPSPGSPQMVAVSPTPTTGHRRTLEAPNCGTVFSPVPGCPDIELGSMVSATSAVSDGGTRLRLFVEPCGFPGTVFWRGSTYQLNEMHLHVPSVNKLFGHEYPMEMHLTHNCKSGDLVLAVMFNFGEHNPEFDKFLEAMNVPGSHAVINMEAILGNGVVESDALTFMGGLVDPRLTPDLQWALSKEIVYISQKQIERYKNLFGAVVAQCDNTV